MQAETLGQGPGWLERRDAAQPFGRLLRAGGGGEPRRLPAQRRRRADDRRADRPGAVGRRGRGVTATSAARTRACLPRPPARGRAPARLRPRRAPHRHGASRRRRLPPLPPGRVHRRHARGPLRPLGRRRHQPPPARPRRNPRPPGRPLHPRAPLGRPRARPASSAASSPSSTPRTPPTRRSRSSPTPPIEVVTITVTEKGYCHRPATGALDADHPDIATTSPTPRRRAACRGSSPARSTCAGRSHGRPITLVSCDNIPGNGADPRRRGPARWPSGAAPGSPPGSRPTPPSPRPWSTASSRRRPPADLAALERDLRLPRRGRRRRRAVPPVGDRDPLRRPHPALGPRRRRLRRRRHAVRAR